MRSLMFEYSDIGASAVWRAAGDKAGQHPIARFHVAVGP